MRIFVTGASGFIGSAVTKSLLAHGHQVLGLARSEASAKIIKDLGADVHRGDLEDLKSLARGAELCDGVAHLGFNHDFSKFIANCEADKRAIEALATPLIGTNRPMLVTSGTGLLPQGQTSDESVAVPTGEHSHPRAASEIMAEEMAKRGARVSVVRLPPTVHGEGDHGFVPMLITLARQKGEAAYIGDGHNRWPAVHRFDAAEVFRLGLEKNSAGVRYHAVAETGIPFRDIATAMGRHLNMPVVSKSGADAAAYYDWFLNFASMNAPATSNQTRERLSWKPTHATLLEDLEHAKYFSA